MRGAKEEDQDLVDEGLSVGDVAVVNGVGGLIREAFGAGDGPVDAVRDVDGFGSADADDA